MTPYWLALAGAIVASIGGQTLLKMGADGGGNILGQFLHPRSLIGLTLYGGAALLYMLALRRIPVSIALPCTAAGYIAVVLLGHFLFAEPITAQKLAALGLICAGVVLLATA
jgi:multidrug transporter EmrE-like cation transporter